MSDDSSDDVKVCSNSSSSDDDENEILPVPPELFPNLITADIEDILYQISYWNTFKIACQKYVNHIQNGQQYDMYRFVVFLELKFLNARHRDLSQNIFCDYHSVTLLFEDVLFQKLKLFDLFPFPISRDQLYVVLSIGISGVDLKTRETYKLTAYEGIVDTVFQSTKYLRSTCYQCVQPQCNEQGAVYCKRVRFSIKEVNEDLSKLSFTCENCNFFLVENKSKREYGEKALIYMKSTPPLKKKGIDQAVKMYLRDEFVEMVSLGKRYNFSGLITCQMLKGKYCFVFEVLCVSEPMNHCLYPLTPNNYLKLKKIYEEGSKCSSWQLVFHMSQMFASCIVPKKMYFGLKLSILLSIVQNVNFHMKDKNALSLCFISSDTNVVNNILKYAAIFYPYYIHLGAEHDILPNSALSARPRKEINAGCLFWTNFIYIIKDINLFKFRQTDMDILSNVLENSHVLCDGLEESSGCIAKVIWASSEENLKETMRESNNKDKVHRVQNKKFQKLINSFSLLYRLNAWDTEDNQGLLTNKFLSLSTSEKENDSLMDTDLWIQYFDSARAWEVTMSDDVLHFIQSYYIKRRHFSAKHETLRSFPSSIVSTLIQLTVAFGKLAFSSDIQVNHAIIPVILVEENLLVRTGNTPFKFLLSANCPKVTALFYEPQSDEIMKEYVNQIVEFCECDS